MPIVDVEGIQTRYEVLGDGPPLLMFSPGGFNAIVENWSSLGVYRRLDLLPQLSSEYSCIVFDRRESGASGGRLERLTWEIYARQGLGLMDHLGLDTAYAMGGCVGCTNALVLSQLAPHRIAGLVLYSPAGGPRYRMAQHDRFIEHLTFVKAEGLEAVVELSRRSQSTFNKDPRLGPWATVLRQDEALARQYVSQDLARYRLLVLEAMRSLFDRDTVPGVEPEALLRSDHPVLIVPGEDASHAPSAARYLQECLPHGEFWDVPVSEQTKETAPARILSFLRGSDANRIA